MIILSIIVSLFLVFAAMALYRSSGAALLDISRPGDEDVRSKVLKTDDSISFSASGTLDKTAFDEFEKKYDKVLNQIQRQTVFSSDPLSAKSLRIDQDSALQQGQTQAE